MCCGKKRKQVRKSSKRKRVSRPKEKTISHTESNSTIYFQYLGKTGLTVIGPRTGTKYHFNRPWAIVVINQNDQQALSQISLLRQVQKPTNVSKSDYEFEKREEPHV